MPELKQNPTLWFFKLLRPAVQWCCFSESKWKAHFSWKRLGACLLHPKRGIVRGASLLHMKRPGSVMPGSCYLLKNRKSCSGSSFSIIPRKKPGRGVSGRAMNTEMQWEISESKSFQHVWYIPMYQMRASMLSNRNLINNKPTRKVA